MGNECSCNCADEKQKEMNVTEVSSHSTLICRKVPTSKGKQYHHEPTTLSAPYDGKI